MCDKGGILSQWEITQGKNYWVSGGGTIASLGENEGGLRE